MLESLTGFVVVGVAIVVGWILGRIDLLGEHARPVLARLTFFVLSPFLLFVVLAQADVRTLFSALLPVSAIAAVAIIAVYALVARLVWKRSVGETVIGALSAGQVNSNNIGIPLSLYLLGSAAYPAPVILLQLLVFTPITMAILDAVTSGRASLWRSILRTVTNPIVLGSVLGTLVSVSGRRAAADRHAAGAAHRQRVRARSCSSATASRCTASACSAHPGRRRDVVLATALKLFAMPLIAWALAEFAFGLSAARGADRDGARGAADRAERLQLLAALRRRRGHLARHDLPDDDRLRARS